MPTARKACSEPIEFVQIEGLTAPYFKCSRLAATLAVSSCTSMYQAAKRPAEALRHSRCIGCPVGAHLAGEIPRPALSERWCVRCHQPGRRMVQTLCVSCYNRSRENDRGFNRKGGAPSARHRQQQYTLIVLSSPRTAEIVSYRVASTMEAVLRAVRDHGRSRFQWAASTRPPALQLSLFGI